MIPFNYCVVFQSKFYPQCVTVCHGNVVALDEIAVYISIKNNIQYFNDPEYKCIYRDVFVIPDDVVTAIKQL